MTGALIKREQLDMGTGRMPLNMKTEIGVMLFTAKECQTLPAIHQKLGQKHETDCLSQPQKVTTLLTF